MNDHRLLHSAMRRTTAWWAVFLITAVAQSLSGEEPAGDAASATTFEQTIRPLLAEHCLRCHGAKKQEAGLRLDLLGPDMLAERSAGRWREIMDRVNLGEMPPEDEPQLSRGQLTRLTEWIHQGLQRVEAASTSTADGIVLRRLNRAEYANTIRDLIGINYPSGKNLPEDPAAHGFDNIGSALSLSPLQMEKYLREARRIVDLAIVTGDQPRREVLRVEAERRGPEDRGYYYAKDLRIGKPPDLGDERGRRLAWTLGSGREELKTEGFEHLTPVDKTEFRTNVLRAIDFTFPHAGEYIIRVRAYGHYPAGPIPDRTHFGPPRLNITSDGVRLLACDVDAPREAPRIYETRFFSEAVQTTVFIRNRYDFSPNWINDVLGERLNFRKPDFPQPYLAVDWYEIDGPVYDAWPPESHTRILFPSPNQENEEVYAREVLEAFARRAFRRPIEDEEIDRLVGAFQTSRASRDNFEEAIKTPLVAVLCSPDFLFLSESSRTGDETRRPLDDYELASRLSYFLWSSMPDEELFRLADSGRLRDEGVLTEQVNRMLADAKSRALVENFVGQWLDARQLGQVVPDAKLFRRYDEHLEESMAGEMYGFFAELLHNDLSVLNLLDSDFAVLNARLARFYNIDGVRGDHFRRVELAPEHHRGGVLAQAGVLTVTSNGTRTSPVKRGVWILENLLGDPPPPPPPNAGEIPPKAPDAQRTTLRERLAIHRRAASCAACHAKIDPLGFALENYDASGFYRTQESSRSQINPHPRDPPVDVSGRLPDGREFEGADQLKQILLADEDKFLTCLCGKLLTYALGRGLQYQDRAVVKQLRDSLKNDGYHLRGLITKIVQTQVFQTK
jgi:mono/diheme cytochrome c family protein